MGTADPALAGAALVAIRQKESLASAKLLGVTGRNISAVPRRSHVHREEAAIAIAKEIVRLKPDIVFAPDPNVRSECHLDHIKTGNAVKTSVIMSPFESIMQSVGGSGCHSVSGLALYYTDKPNAYVPVKKTFGARKAALLEHKSQFDEKTIDDIVMYFKLRSVRFGLRTLKGLSDGYRALSPMHMHCFPEASEW
jgi:LmbE family N-acetylglucosaminyl deacetylase